jgi:hypothetical protein
MRPSRAPPHASDPDRIHRTFMCRAVLWVTGGANMSRYVIGRSLLGALLVLASVGSPAAGGQGAGQAPSCQPAGSVVRVPDLPEGSGVAVSRRTSGRLWAHNDSGEPELIALDAQGAVVGRVRIGGAKVEDWEALAAGTCPAGNCLYIGDIGDNDARRRSITIYRIAEPAEPGGTVDADVLRAVYPNGPRNAEALLVTPRGDVLIVTKGDTAPVAVYRMPAAAKPGDTVTLEQVGAARDARKAAAGDRITDGAVSPSGQWTALRTTSSVLLLRTADLLSGTWRDAGRTSVKSLREPQGEGVAFADDQTIYLVGEGGSKKRPGTFGRLSCGFDSATGPADR